MRNTFGIKKTLVVQFKMPGRSTHDMLGGGPNKARRDARSKVIQCLSDMWLKPASEPASCRLASGFIPAGDVKARALAIICKKAKALGYNKKIKAEIVVLGRTAGQTKHCKADVGQLSMFSAKCPK